MDLKEYAKMSLKNQNENNDKSSDGYYKTQFIEITQIGHSSSFGKIFAVKRVEFEDFSEEEKQKILKEVKILSKLDLNFVVKYHNSWLESNHLYIRMEFCPQSLRDFIDNKVIVFERQPEDHMNSVFEYYISCEIFKEILRSVQYLHECKPPVIHRDLKPENILISANIMSNRCVKLCDFGLATVHNIDGNTSSRYDHSVCGTLKYIAPEVYSRKYNHLADMYSLYVIGEQLFSIDYQASTSFDAKESVFRTSMQCMYRTLLAMMSTPNWRQRPECREVLAKHNEWSIDKSVVTNHKEFNS
ncbi:unnamed protein product, partial [Medioppia subpectinata]